MHSSSSSAASRCVRATVAIFAVILSALVAAGCGSTLDETFVKQTGTHGNALEKVYALYNLNVLKDASSRDLKDINAALKAEDLKQATEGDLRRAESEIQSRIDKLQKYRTKMIKANRQLKNTPMPDFAAGLDDDFANQQFAKDYEATTKNIQKYTTADLAAVKYGFSALEKYLDFLEQWEEYLSDDSTDGLVAAGEASDKALAKLNQVGKRIDARGTLTSKIKPLVDGMADASSDSEQLTTLIDEMKKQYPKSFLAVHIVEKK